MRTIRPYDKTEKKGRLWAALILVFNLLFSLLFLVVDLNPLMPLIQFGLSFALYFGFQGLRWAYAGVALINLCLTLYYLMGGYFEVIQWSALTIAAVILLILFIIFSAGSAIIYYTENSICEYMYRKRTDY